MVDCCTYSNIAIKTRAVQFHIWGKIKAILTSYPVTVHLFGRIDLLAGGWVRQRCRRLHRLAKKLDLELQLFWFLPSLGRLACRGYRVPSRLSVASPFGLHRDSASSTP